MLTCLFINWVVVAVKRFDAIVLHAWESAREVVGAARSSNQRELAD